MDIFAYHACLPDVLGVLWLPYSNKAYSLFQLIT